MVNNEPVSGIDETVKKGEPGTFWHIFLEPTRCFEGLNIKPRWLIPLILSMVIAFTTGLVISNRVDMEQAVRKQIASSQAASQLTEEQIDQQVQMSAKIGKVSTLVAPVVITPLFMVLIAGLIMLGVFVLGSEVNGQDYQGEGVESRSAFSRVFAITVSSMFFYNVVGGILAITVLLIASDPNSLNLQNLVSTNPAFLVDATESKVLYSFLSHLDILVWYTLFLIGLGISKISQKCSVAKGVMIIGFWYVLYSLAHTGVAALF